MSHAGLHDGGAVNGTWSLASGEEFAEEVQLAIILLNGLLDTDWAVVPTSYPRVLLLRKLILPSGEAAWAFESEMYRP